MTKIGYIKLLKSLSWQGKSFLCFWVHLHAMAEFYIFRTQCVLECGCLHFHFNQRDYFFIFADGNTETPGQNRAGLCGLLHLLLVSKSHPLHVQVFQL